MNNPENNMTGITAFFPIFNEEKRVRACLTTLTWCNEVILLDKGSTDNTREIASTFKNVTIIKKQENSEVYSASEFEIFMQHCHTKWCMVVTASDVIHKELADAIVPIIQLENLPYDTIAIPYRPFMLGQCEKYSPWYAEYSSKIVKTESVKLNLGSVHNVFTSARKSIYKLEIKNKNAAYYHLTHEDAEGILVRHSRYWRGEANSTIPLSSDIRLILKKLAQLIFIKRTFFKGYAAIALAFSYLSYHMMTFVFKWDKQYGEGRERYDQIRKEVVKSWTEN